MKLVVTLTKQYFKSHPKAGEPTQFADMVRGGSKIHTCRDNADYWIGKIESLKATGGTLCIREWSGRPYRSPQDTVMEICHYHTYSAIVGNRHVLTEEIAKNDGFDNEHDFLAFLDPLFDKYQSETIRLAIIHFTDFRY